MFSSPSTYDCCSVRVNNCCNLTVAKWLSSECQSTPKHAGDRLIGNAIFVYNIPDTPSVFCKSQDIYQ